jgi:hypothetical protein
MCRSLLSHDLDDLSNVGLTIIEDSNDSSSERRNWLRDEMKKISNTSTNTKIISAAVSEMRSWKIKITVCWRSERSHFLRDDPKEIRRPYAQLPNYRESQRKGSDRIQLGKEEI